MKFLIAVILLLVATGIISYNNGAFHFSQTAANNAYDNVKSSTSQATKAIEHKKEAEPDTMAND